MCLDVELLWLGNCLRLFQGVESQSGLKKFRDTLLILKFKFTDERELIKSC